MRRGLNLEILENQDCRHFENWSLPIFKMSGKIGSVFKTLGKSTPMRRLRRRPRALPRPGMGVDFPNVLKTDPNFPDILKMGRLQFSKSTVLVFQNFKFYAPTQVPKSDASGAGTDFRVVLQAWPSYLGRPALAHSSPAQPAGCLPLPSPAQQAANPHPARIEAFGLQGCKSSMFAIF